MNKSKTYIYKLTFNENNLIFEGETFNKKWKETINIKDITIKIIGEPARNICNRVYFLKFKNFRKNYSINSIETFSDNDLLSIFNYYKETKNEKIEYDDKYLIERIQEKINSPAIPYFARKGDRGAVFR